MKFEIRALTSRSVSIEIMDETAYKNEKEYSLILDDGKERKFKNNVVSFFGLLPSTSHILTLIDSESVKESLSFKTLSESVFFNVKDFGAKGDGVKNDLAAINAAIMSAPAGATIYFPKGTYLTTPVFLKSDITLYFDEGAELLGSTDRNDYPILKGMIPSTNGKSEVNLASWEGNPLTSFASLITGINVINVKITGPGTINGNADKSDWWVNPKAKRIAWRPDTIFLNGCENILVQGVTVKNSPSWTVHPYYSNNLKFVDITVWNPFDSPNTDGFDPESCRNVELIGSLISVGDDCVAIKSGKYYMSQYHYAASKNITIRNCRFERGHGSVTVGSEVSGGVTGVRVSRCIFSETDRGLRIKTRRGRGQLSVIDDIIFENVIMDRVHMPFTVNMFYFCDPDGHSEYVQDQKSRPVDEGTPSIGSFYIDNVKCTGVDAAFITMAGLPESPIKEAVIKNTEAVFLPENERKRVVPVMMDNFEALSGCGIYLLNVENVSVENLRIKGSADKKARLFNVQNSSGFENVRYEDE